MIVEELKKSILDNLLYGKAIINYIKNICDCYPDNFPYTWKIVKIGEVFEVLRGGSPRPIKSFLTTESDGVNWIKIGDTEKGSKYINSCKEKIIADGVKKSRFVTKGDFLLSNSMSFGRPYILNIDGCIHDGWLVLKDKENTYNKDFLFYVLSSDMVYKQFCEKAAGAVVTNLNIDKVKDTCIPLPPTEEQQRIVDKIEELFIKLDEIKPIEDELETMKSTFPDNMRKSILNDSFSGTANFINEDYENWESDLIINIADIYTGNSIPESVKKNKYANTEIGYNYIATKDLLFNHTFNYNNGIKIPYSEKGFKYASKNDILMCIEGGSAGKKIGILDEKVCYGNKLCKFSIKTDSVIPKFLYYYLQSNVFLKNFYENLNGIIGGVSVNKIKKIIVKYPSISEQKLIVEKIEQLLSICDDIDNIVRN